LLWAAGVCRGRDWLGWCGRSGRLICLFDWIDGGGVHFLAGVSIMVAMARRHHPPLATAVRPFYWVVRTWGVLVGLGALYIGVLAAVRGSWSIVITTLILAGGFVVLTWMHPLSRWFVPTLVGQGILAVILLQSKTTAAILAAVIGIGVWSRLRPLRGGGARVDPNKIFIDEPGAVMKNARAFVDEFEATGFEQVGALRFSFGPIKVIESLLLSPDGLSYAAVTDAIVHVTSIFSGGRGLVTRNSDHVVLPDYLLVDSVAGGTPAESIESHGRALALVAERDHYPIPVAAFELPQIALKSERAAIAWANTNRRVARSASGRGALWSRRERYEQIDAWHGAGQTEPDA